MAESNEPSVKGTGYEIDRYSKNYSKVVISTRTILLQLFRVSTKRQYKFDTTSECAEGFVSLKEHKEIKICG